ncbi:Thioredoxin reductase [bioreactor metagenome]|uniref:Thioredoxin reductase n=1 Tax=bioreactor metagenome TaxID=1076179 RepID=A0A645CQ48_9ZZZZ
MIDIAIIGAGPAGLTAGLYAGRGGAKAVVFEEMFSGGQAASTYKIENYPGFPDGVSGMDLGMLMEQQAQRFGTEIKNERVTSLELDGAVKRIKTDGGEYEAKTVILAFGAAPRPLGVENEEKLRGMGVSYCATCDGAFFRDKTVAVVGGGDTAIADAIYLARFAQKIYVIHRRDSLRASSALQETAFANERIAFVWDSVVEGLIGDQALSALKLKNVKTGELSQLDVSGVFVAVGTMPKTELVSGKVELSGDQYILTDVHMKTNIQGVFAAGDVRVSPLKQVVTAVADGAVAASEAIAYINK